VAPGGSRFETERVNRDFVEADDGFTVVDAGLPAHREQLFDGR
jgi:hypothetical protein